MPFIPSPCECNSMAALSPLTCETDSVTICPGDDPIAVTVANLDCSTDSVTVCAESLDIRSLTSGSDSVTVVRPEDWAVNSAPAAAIAASATKAAAPGVRHFATAISFSVMTTTTAPTTTTLTVTLRDGATGVGTVLMVWRVRVSAAMTDQNVAQVTLGGLNVAGSVSTAMTLEFDVGVINTLEDVSLTGYSVA